MHAPARREKQQRKITQAKKKARMLFTLVPLLRYLHRMRWRAGASKGVKRKCCTGSPL